MMAMAAVTWLEPCWLSDNNKFLADFVNQELLAVLGVIVTITLASAASLHLELNKLEDDHGETFDEARRATKAYAYMLIWLFLGAMALVIAKPIGAQTEFAQAIFNSVAILIIVLNVMALMDLTGAVFQIPAQRRFKPVTNLKQARESDKLDQFAKDRESDAPGDAEAFNRALASMAGKSKEAPAASQPDHPGD